MAMKNSLWLLELRDAHRKAGAPSLMIVRAPAQNEARELACQAAGSDGGWLYPDSCDVTDLDHEHTQPAVLITRPEVLKSGR